MGRKMHERPRASSGPPGDGPSGWTMQDSDDVVTNPADRRTPSLLRWQLKRLALRLKLALSVRTVTERLFLRGATSAQRDSGASVQVEHVTGGVTDLKVRPLYTKRAIVFNRNLYLCIAHVSTPY